MGSPDGFGGKVCKGAVKSAKDQVADAVINAVVNDDQPAKASAPSAPAAPAPPTKPKAAAVAPPPPVVEKPLTFEELVANSIANKESFLGRPLSDAEKADMEAKVK